MNLIKTRSLQWEIERKFYFNHTFFLPNFKQGFSFLSTVSIAIQVDEMKELQQAQDELLLVAIRLPSRIVCPAIQGLGISRCQAVPCSELWIQKPSLAPTSVYAVQPKMVFQLFGIKEIGFFILSLHHNDCIVTQAGSWRREDFVWRGREIAGWDQKEWLNSASCSEGGFSVVGQFQADFSLN